MAFSWIKLCGFLGHSLTRCLEARIVMLVGGFARSDQNVHEKRDGIMATLFIDGWIMVMAGPKARKGLTLMKSKMLRIIA